MPCRSNTLIVGGGLAGLFCALKLAPQPATVLTGAPIGEGASSAWAQGGVAAALSEGDSPQKHAADTVAAGAGIVAAEAALGMAHEARARVEDLLTYGVPFDKDLAGRLMQSREAAHSERRIVRVKGDTAGKAIMAALVAAVHQTPSIELAEGFVAEILLQKEGRVTGVQARGPDGRVHSFLAPASVLATGGVGQLYAVTTNPPEARGLGLAIAARAGAVIADAEFVQFHPTAIAIGRDPAPLATEALRGEGATLVNRAGDRFMVRLHKDAELAPRDIVARGVFAELMAGRGAFLDARTAIGAAFGERFPTVYGACQAAGIDPARMLVPVAPAEHYHMGGIATDARGRTSLPGLWAAGEVASTGVHGANRLASNSLLEAVVFGARVAADLSSEALRPVDPQPASEELRRGPAPSADAKLIARLRRTMSEKVGVIRDGSGLQEAVADIAAIEGAAASGIAANMAATALLIAVSALRRRESRGGHYRADFPTADPDLAQRSRITLAEARELAQEVEVP
ncbi:MAG: L-aspartate oxidase [Methylobacteriaceae bacterium]|nr:L-aspartate oxidase [Methylobacteriaceae bacterium]